MKNWIAAFILMVPIIGAGRSFSTDKKTLAGVFEPGMIKAAENRLYVFEGAKILVFSLQDLSPVGQFGKQGEGPGELKATDFWYNTVTVLPEQVFVDGYDKVVYFSKEGRFVKEMKKPVGISRLLPVGEDFAAIKLDQIEGDTQYQCLNLYDSNMRFVKQLVRQESPIQSVSGKTEMIPDVLNFAVWEKKIFVETSRAGFVIEVFDSQGKPLYRIEKPHDKIPITKDHRNEAIEAFKDDPFVKRVGFQEFAKLSDFVWPDSWPAIRDFLISEGNIYVRTYKTLNGEENWVILDLQGQTLGSVYLPQVEAEALMANLYGVHRYAIHKNRFYFLEYKQDTGDWELRIKKIS
jgi:hypothetical protein